MFFIFLIILIILIILLISPIKFKINFENSKFDVFFSYLFLKLDSKKWKNKDIKKKSIKGEGERKSNYIKKIPTYLKMLKIIFPIFILFLKKIKLRRIHFFLRISSSDAKNCALTYSYAYSLLKSVANILNMRFKIKDLRIRLLPDFTSFENSYSGEFILSISLLDILSVLIYGIFIYFKNSREMRE